MTIEVVLTCRVVAESRLPCAPCTPSGPFDDTTSSGTCEQEEIFPDRGWRARKVRKTKKKSSEKTMLRLPLDVKPSSRCRPRWSHRNIAYDSSDEGPESTDDEEPYTEDLSNMWTFL
eukprot:TRINITY_DN730_c0_g1_i1.p1 TRINITY_DN730_c0_g1~~TRINITY_DN730_c0_g1_i1.p1  ORF type:complete len:117 (+),score=26.04 TRINITY_DN730_c0_g1_i1:41-391(+)